MHALLLDSSSFLSARSASTLRLRFLCRQTRAVAEGSFAHIDMGRGRTLNRCYDTRDVVAGSIGVTVGRRRQRDEPRPHKMVEKVTRKARASLRKPSSLNLRFAWRGVMQVSRPVLAHYSAVCDGAKQFELGM